MAKWTEIYEGKVKSSSLAYNWCETWDKHVLGRDPDRIWGHLHISVKLFWSQPMAPWTSAATNKCAAPQSMDPWAATKKALHYCGGDASSCLCPYPMTTCPEFHVSCRLSWELFILPVCCHQCPWDHGLWPKQLYHTCSVAVTPAPVWFPTHWLLVPSFM